MFGNDLNLDDLKEKMGQIKEKIEIVKEKDGVIIKFLDPEMANDPSVSSMLDPSKLAGMNAMSPDGGEMPEIEVEQVEGGMKFKTSDPDAVYEMLNQMLDPEFLVNMLKQMMEMFTKPGGLFSQLGDAMGGLGDALGGDAAAGDSPAAEPAEETLKKKAPAPAKKPASDTGSSKASSKPKGKKKR